MRETTLTPSHPLPFLRLLSVLVVVVGCASSAWSAPTAITDGAGDLIGVEGLEVGGKTLRVDFKYAKTAFETNSYDLVYGTQVPYFMNDLGGAKEAAVAMQSVVTSFDSHGNIFIPYYQPQPDLFEAYGIDRNTGEVGFALPTFDTDGDLGIEAWFTKFTETSTPMVPVPSSLFLLGTGLFGLNAARRKKARQA